MLEIPKIKESTKFNFITSIWIVPTLAVFISLWLAYQYFSQLGPLITIVFPKNEGLNAGQSQIKYKNVRIGVVEKIILNEDAKGVSVIARIDKNAKSYLNEHSEFWIVKPELGISGVSGLETILSGTYINMYTEKGTQFNDTFNGIPHAHTKTLKGGYFKLEAPVSYNLKIGTPLYFKDISVGKIQTLSISPDSSMVDFSVFVEEKYLIYVTKDSKFWVNSAISLNLSNATLDIKVAPFTYLLQGGISFSSSGKNIKKKLADNFVFLLYKSEAFASNKMLGEGGKFIKEYAVEVQGESSKLAKDAPVQYQGFTIGKVEKTFLSYNNKNHKIQGEVILKIDTSFFKDKSNAKSGEKNFHQAIKEGLKAKVLSNNPLLSTLFVELVFTKDGGTRDLVKKGNYLSIPSTEDKQTSIIKGINAMLFKLNNLPLESLLASIEKAAKMSDELLQNTNTSVKSMNQSILKDLKQTMSNLNKMTNKDTFVNMPNQISIALKELTNTLETTKELANTYGQDSLLSEQLSQTLKAVNKTSMEMHHFLKMLNRKPNSLIFGDK